MLFILGLLHRFEHFDIELNPDVAMMTLFNSI